MQSIKVDDYVSDRMKCDICVPQGSFLGPLVLSYVNDIHKHKMLKFVN